MGCRFPEGNPMARRTARPTPTAELVARGRALAVRTVTNLLHRFDELLARATTDPTRMRPVFGKQGRVLLALDGVQPDVGHEVLWVIRDGLSGRVVVAKPLLSGTGADLAALFRELTRLHRTPPRPPAPSHRSGPAGSAAPGTGPRPGC